MRVHRDIKFPPVAQRPQRTFTFCFSNLLHARFGVEAKLTRTRFDELLRRLTLKCNNLNISRNDDFSLGRSGSSFFLPYLPYVFKLAQSVIVASVLLIQLFLFSPHLWKCMIFSIPPNYINGKEILRCNEIFNISCMLLKINNICW